MSDDTTKASATTVPRWYAEDIDSAESRLEWLRSMESEAILLQSILDRYPTLSPWVSAHEGSSSHWTVYVSPLSHIANEVAPLLRDLAAHGWRLKSEPYSDNAAENVTWPMVKVGSCELHVYANTTTGTCQRVQIGTKEMPVYEIRCGEAAS